MAHAEGKGTIGESGVPALVLTYRESMDGVGPVWIARSIVTGHVACGSSEDKAKECLRRTISGSIALAKRHGKTFDEWFREQKPDENQYVEEYFKRARAGGQRIESTDFGPTVAVAPA